MSSSRFGFWEPGDVCVGLEKQLLQQWFADPTHGRLPVKRREWEEEGKENIARNQEMVRKVFEGEASISCERLQG